MIIGIDPGLTGACAELDTFGDFSELWDIPTVEFGGGRVKRRVDGRMLANQMYEGSVSSTTAYLELVSSMPGQGVASMFSMGQTYGVIRGVIEAIGHPLKEVRPQAWKKHFNLDKDKDAARLLAIELFPEAADMLARKKDHNRAEALLIAQYGFDMERGK